MLPYAFSLRVLCKKIQEKGTFSGVGWSRICVADVRELQVLFCILSEKYVSLFPHWVFSETFQCEAVGMEMAFDCVWSDIRLGCSG